MGTSLLVMVAGLAKSKNNTDDEKAALAKARAAIEPITSRLTDLADADAASFDAVMAAYRLPKATDEEKIARTQAIQSALRGATEIPLETLRACADALAHARVVADYGNRSADSDVGVAIGLLEGGGGRRRRQRADQPGRTEGRGIQVRHRGGNGALTGAGRPCLTAASTCDGSNVQSRCEYAGHEHHGSRVGHVDHAGPGRVLRIWMSSGSSGMS